MPTRPTSFESRPAPARAIAPRRHAGRSRSGRMVAIGPELEWTRRAPDISGQGRWQILGSRASERARGQRFARGSQAGRVAPVSKVNEREGPNEMASRRAFDREARRWRSYSNRTARRSSMSHVRDQPFVSDGFIRGQNLDAAGSRGARCRSSAGRGITRQTCRARNATEHGPKASRNSKNIVLRRSGGVGRHVQS